MASLADSLPCSVLASKISNAIMRVILPAPSRPSKRDPTGLEMHTVASPDTTRERRLT